MMNSEYIVPMTDQTREITLYPRDIHGVNGGNGQPPEGIPSPGHSTSLKPQMHCVSPCFVRGDGMEGDGAVEIACSDSPEIPLDMLKNLTVDMLSAGVWAVGQAVRDPAGGNIELLLVPLLRLFYSLLVMGVFGDEDLGKVLALMEPGVFSTNADSHEEDDEEASDDEKECKKGCIKKDDIQQGLLQMKLPEAVKLEVNELSEAIFMFLFPYFVFTLNDILLDSYESNNHILLMSLPSSAICCRTCVTARCATG